jgi:hypothetical protein
VELEVARDDASEQSAQLLMHHADDSTTVIASARPGDAHTLVVPDFVRALSLEQARAGGDNYPFRDAHPFPHCVCCGTQRDNVNPSLKIFCGRVLDAQVPIFADVWTPTRAFADPASPTHARREAVFSALDCPSATPFADPDAQLPLMLGQIDVALHQPVRIDESHIVAAWAEHIDGRKHWSTSALLDAHGEFCGVARALWIQVRAS